MRYLQHEHGVTSVAFAPDGTLFAHTERHGRLWAHAAGSGKRELVAEDERMTGWLEVSPDGAWVSVSGLQQAVLLRLGSPAEWHTFPGTTFYQRGHFTGDSAAWVGRTGGAGNRNTFYSFRLPEYTTTEHPVASALPCLRWVIAPDTADAVVYGWSRQLRSGAMWRADLTRPDAPAELLGTVPNCSHLAVAPDGRLFVSHHDNWLRVFTPRDGQLHEDFAAHFPQFGTTPEVQVSTDGRRFVVRAFQSKLVYAGDTATGELFGPWDWKVGRVNGVATSHDGLTAAAAGSNKVVVVWDLE